MTEQLSLPLLDNLATAILVLRPDNSLSYLNSSAEALLDVSGKRAIDLPLSRILDAKSQAFVSLIDALAMRTACTKRSEKLILVNGQEITVDYTLTPFEQKGQQFTALELRGLDRMLRISREESLLTTQSTSRLLVRGLAHEIKNPLGGIRGAAQLLEAELDDEELKEYTAIIISETDRLSALVDRLLGPHKPPQLRAVNIHEILERVCTLIKAEQNIQLEIQRDYDPSIPELQGDADQLLQAVLNIVRNAMQALKNTEQPQITLRTRVLRQHTISKLRHKLVAHLAIIDNGPGVSPELIETMFYPMISGRPEGSGLGLSIAQSILSQHQGLIECHSEPGETTFSIFIPLEPRHEH
jgi:two-component system nitrogen regulation sensor histidine kinase GlnL